MLHLPFFHQMAHHRSWPAARRYELDLAGIGIALLGRAMFSAIFLLGAWSHLVNRDETVEFAMAAGVPWPEVLVPLTGLMILAGGLGILLGYQARLAAWLLVLFLLPAALLMHRFWGLADSNLATVQFSQFMKNVAMAGAALLLTQVGAGPGSLDRD